MDPWMDPCVDPCVDPSTDPSNKKKSKKYFFVPKGIHNTPTGDNPHAACPSRPRWGVTPYIGRSSPGQLLGVKPKKHTLTGPKSEIR